MITEQMDNLTHNHRHDRRHCEDHLHRLIYPQ